MPGGRLDRRGAEPNALRKPAMVAEIWAVRKISSRREALKSRKETLGSVGCGGRPRWGAKEDEAAFIMSFFGLTVGGAGRGVVFGVVGLDCGAGVIFFVGEEQWRGGSALVVRSNRVVASTQNGLTQ